MRRASASDQRTGKAPGPRRSKRRVLGQGAAAGALAVVVAAGAPAVVAVADDSDETGTLRLNATVLVNDSVGAGSAGDFPIRGSLFSERLYVRIGEQREASAERLTGVRELDFAAPKPSGDQYQSVRAALFENYSSSGIASKQREGEESSALLGVVAVLAVPLMLIAGIGLGRFWARRRRATS